MTATPLNDAPLATNLSAGESYTEETDLIDADAPAGQPFAES